MLMPTLPFSLESLKYRISLWSCRDDKMAELLLRVPDDVKREFETVLGRKIPEKMWQLLFSRFLNDELKKKLFEIKKIESIISKSKLTEKQAKKLADEVSLSMAKRFLDSAGIAYSKDVKSS